MASQGESSDGSHYEKRGKGEPVCIDDEIPFDIPESWEWVRLRSVVVLLSGQDFESMDYNSAQKGIPYFTGASNIENGNLIVNRWTEKPRCIVKPGNLLIVCKGAGVGKMAIVPDGIGRAHIARQIMAIDCLGHYCERYVSCYIEVKLRQVREQMQGVIPGISRDVLLSILMPLPPFAEQQRILAELDSLNSLVSIYGQLEEARIKLDADLPDKLRKSILQMAVQGKLVEQDPNDEPASALLERIRSDRSALVKAGKLKAPKGGESVIYRASDGGYYEKRGKGEPVCIDDEIPFELPESWAWTRLPEVADLRIGKTPSRHDERYWTNGRHPWFSISDMSDAQTISHSKELISDAAMTDCFKGSVSPAGTLLMSFKLTIGKTSILGVDAVHNEAIVSVIPHLDQKDTLRDYLLYALPFAAQNGDFKGAIKGNTLNSKSMSMLLIPLPPLCEQRRVVCRLEKLLQMLTNQ